MYYYSLHVLQKFYPQFLNYANLKKVKIMFWYDFGIGTGSAQTERGGIQYQNSTKYIL